MKLNKKEAKRLVELYESAQTTPVITVNSSMPSFAHQARDRVKEYMDELGEKYNFDPKSIKGIKPNGEIIL